MIKLCAIQSRQTVSSRNILFIHISTWKLISRTNSWENCRTYWKAIRPSILPTAKPLLFRDDEIHVTTRVCHFSGDITVCRDMNYNVSPSCTTNSLYRQYPGWWDWKFGYGVLQSRLPLVDSSHPCYSIVPGAEQSILRWVIASPNTDRVAGMSRVVMASAPYYSPWLSYPSYQ